MRFKRKVFNAYNEIYWWFTHRFNPRHQYHIIRTSLKPGYYDPCERIRYAIFEEVQTFLQRTEGLYDWSITPEHQRAFEELTAAVSWWRENKDYEDTLWEQDGPATKIMEREAELSEQQKYHLKKIIDNLNSLWH